MENKRISYVEPIDAPAGKACRGCDMPNTVDNPVVLQGHAPMVGRFMATQDVLL